MRRTIHRIAFGILLSLMPAGASPCGGAGQRACCLGEAKFGACKAGLREKPQQNSGLCGGVGPFQSSGVCVANIPCGGPNQRACCVGEATFGACNGAHLVEVPNGPSGQCWNHAWGVQSSGVCRIVTPCGGLNQRACCVGESRSPCNPGLVERPRPGSGYCGNAGGTGIQSSGICEAVPPCGGPNERACCAGERHFGACNGPGLVEEPRPRSGQCGNALWGVQSNGVCRVVTPCGKKGERACCTTERMPSCFLGHWEESRPNSGLCGNAHGSGMQSNGVCREVTPCGGENQRACCVGEGEPCRGDDLREEAGVTGNARCGNSLLSSSGTCRKLIPRWAGFHTQPEDGCSRIGVRRYTSELIDASRNPDKGLEICKSMPLEFRGKRYDRPTGCRLEGAERRVIGYLDVEDSGCEPRFGKASAFGCVGDKQMYEAQLVNIPFEELPKSLCESKRWKAEINGKAYAPDSCPIANSYTRRGQFGIFYVPDSTCRVIPTDPNGSSQACGISVVVLKNNTFHEQSVWVLDVDSGQPKHHGRLKKGEEVTLRDFVVDGRAFSLILIDVARVAEWNEDHPDDQVSADEAGPRSALNKPSWFFDNEPTVMRYCKSSGFLWDFSSGLVVPISGLRGGSEKVKAILNAIPSPGSKRK